eukprot:scaffold7488_cov149-Isochrysis_galbana.AAC.2
MAYCQPICHEVLRPAAAGLPVLLLLICHVSCGQWGRIALSCGRRGWFARRRSQSIHFSPNGQPSRSTILIGHDTPTLHTQQGE